jgi:hypothetical protein
MKPFIYSAGTITAFLLPFAALADAVASPSSGNGLFGVLSTIGSLISVVTPLVVALSLLAFLWGLAMYILSLGSSEGDKNKNKGRDLMVYGILTLFVIVSVWGLVNILKATIFPSGAAPSAAPQIPYIIHP